MILYSIAWTTIKGSISCLLAVTRNSKAHNMSQAANGAKRQCTGSTSAPKIGTHSGTFHCDEALACYLLKLLPEYAEASVTRTRDESLLRGCDIVVDVGGVYDPKTHRYDHHQKSFNHSLSSLRPDKSSTIRLSSAGLVYNHFGHRIISTLLEVALEDKRVEVVFDKVYENFVQEIDAIDNGVSICETPVYEIHTNLSRRVSHLNPSWDEETTDQILDNKFLEAQALVGSEFKACVLFYGKNWYSARSIVKEAIDKRFTVDESGGIVDLMLTDVGRHVPWKEHLFSLEEELSLDPIKFVLFTDTSNKWRVQAVPVSAHSFKCRLPLHLEWQGLRNDELSAKSGIPESIFVHASGFIGGNETRDGVLSMARKTLHLASR